MDDEIPDWDDLDAERQDLFREALARSGYNPAEILTEACMKNPKMTAYTIHLTDEERDHLVQLIEKSGEFKRGALYSAADELTGEIDFVGQELTQN